MWQKITATIVNSRVVTFAKSNKLTKSYTLQNNEIYFFIDLSYDLSYFKQIFLDN